MPHRSGKKVTTRINPTDKRLMYLLFVLLLLLASLTIIQQPQDIRKRAQVTPTPLLRCGTPCTVNAHCPNQLVCFEGSCRNPECANKENCACIVTPTPLDENTEVLISTTPFITPSPILIASSTSVMEEQTIQTTEKVSILQIIIHFVQDKVCQLFKQCKYVSKV